MHLPASPLSSRDGHRRPLGAPWRWTFPAALALWAGALSLPAVPPTITSQPQSVLAHPRARVEFNVTAEGDLPLVYQWRKNGVALPRGTNATLTISNVTTIHAGKYSVRVANGEGAVISSNATLVVDAIRPTVRIRPIPPRLTNEPNVTLTGTASDNRGLSHVFCRINQGAAQAATGTSNWQVQLSLGAGTNRISAYSVDTAGNTSVAHTVSIFLPVPWAIIFQTNGVGSATGVTNGQVLQIGRAYTVRATGVGTNVFYGWKTWIDGSTNGVTNTSHRAVFTFLMQSNLVLEATFIPNPYILAKGTYRGLFFPTWGVGMSVETSGSLTLTLNESGTFSGNFRLARGYIPFTGRFNGAGEGSAIIPQDNAAPAYLAIRFFTNQVMSGQVSGQMWPLDFFLTRVKFFRGDCPFAGRYTFYTEGSGETNVPPGNGAFTLVVTTNGDVAIGGTMPDSTAVRATSAIARDGYLPWFSLLYNSQGMVLGWLNATNTTDYTPGLGWQRPAVTGARFYPGGFSDSLLAHGSPYVAPTNGGSSFNWTNGYVLLSGGNLSAPLSNEVQVLNNQFTVLNNSNGLALSIIASNGLITGTFTNPATRQRTPIKGVVVQHGRTGRGWFLGRNRGGKLEIGPRE